MYIADRSDGLSKEGSGRFKCIKSTNASIHTPLSVITLLGDIGIFCTPNKLRKNRCLMIKSFRNGFMGSWKQGK